MIRCRPILQLGVAVVAAAVTLSACSGGGKAAGRSTTTTAPPSRTPQIHGDASELRPLLLKLTDVRGIDGISTDVAVVPPAQAPFFENPDPRGPCGAKVDQPPLSGGASVAFSTSDAALANVVIRPGRARAEAFLRELVADERTPCPPYDSTTNTGQRQHVEPIVVEVPGHPQDVVAVQVQITTAGETAFGAAVMLGHEDLLDVLFVLSPDPVQANTILALTARMTDAVGRGIPD